MLIHGYVKISRWNNCREGISGIFSGRAFNICDEKFSMCMVVSINGKQKEKENEKQYEEENGMAATACSLM